MIKRKRFIIKGNIHLKFIICFLTVIAGGVLIAVYLIYRSSNEIVEKATFSCHLSVNSTGELFYRTILETNLLIAGISVIMGLVAIGFFHLYLESFFLSLAEALRRMARGDFDFRLKTKGGWMVSRLLKDVNGLIANLENDSLETTRLLDSLLGALDSGALDLNKIKAANELLGSKCRLRKDQEA